MTTETPYDFPEPGCYADGARGLHEQYRILFGIAEGYGFIYGPAEGEPSDPADHEFADDIADDAIDFLNELEQWREGYAWSFQDGDFGLWCEDDDEDDDCE